MAAWHCCEARGCRRGSPRTCRRNGQVNKGASLAGKHTGTRAGVWGRQLAAPLRHLRPSKKGHRFLKMFSRRLKKLRPFFFTRVRRDEDEDGHEDDLQAIKSIFPVRGGRGRIVCLTELFLSDEDEDEDDLPPYNCRSYFCLQIENEKANDLRLK